MEDYILKRRIRATIKEYASENQNFSNFWNLLTEQGDFYIVGGAIRAAYLEQRPRDIDIITRTNVDDLIEKIDDEIDVNKNYFGGYKINFHGIIIDIWDFSRHWAFKAGILEPLESNLAESLFYNFDALVYSPVSNYLNIKSFKNSLKTSTIDFMRHDSEYIYKNPGRLTNVIRAIFASLRFKLSFSEEVTKYIRALMERKEVTVLRDLELRHYQEEKITENEYLEVLQNI